MTRPKKNPEDKYARMSISLPPAVIEQLRELQKTAWGEVPASQVISRLIAKAYFEGEEEEE